MVCKECKSVLIDTPGKRKKEFCNSTCRSNFWQKERRKKKDAKAPVEEKKEEEKVAEVTTSKETEVKPAKKYPANDPKEGSMAFYTKYEASSYEEYEKKLAKKQQSQTT